MNEKVHKLESAFSRFPVVRGVLFVAIGGIAYLIYAASLYLALQFLNWDIFGAVIFAYAMTIAFHFPANRYFTFADRRTAIGKELMKYAQVYVFTSLLAYLLSLLKGALGIQPYWGYLLPAVSVSITYVLSKNYIWATDK